MNKIILIDDDEKFKEIFVIKALDQNIPLHVFYKNSFAGLKEMMPKYSRQVTSVVLDVKCLMTPDQAKEDEGFIGTALTYLDGVCPGFPRIILTGDDDSFANLPKYFRNELIFQKTPEGMDAAFEKLNFFSKNSEDLRIKNLYSDVFSLFERKYYSAIEEATLLNILNKIETQEFAKFGGIFRDIRALQEAVYKNISEKNKAVIPKSLFKSNGMLDFNKLMRHLNGNPPYSGQASTTPIYQNSAIYELADSLYWTTGKYIHSDPKEKYFVSNYTVKAMVFSLMEIFLWSESFLK